MDIGGIFRLFPLRSAGDPFISSLLDVELIEGDDVSLEATNAQIIRGKRVKVGDRCRIDTVEYSESLEVSPKATVQRQVKT